MDAGRIRIDIGSVTAQVRRLRDLGDELGRAVGDFETARRLIANGWSDPAGQAYLAANESLLDRIRRELDEILSLPDKFTAWIQKWVETVRQNLEDVTKLPD